MGECISLRFKILDECKAMAGIRSVRVHKYLGDNGIVLLVQMQSTNIYLVIQLIHGDQELAYSLKTEDNTHARVLDFPVNFSSNDYYVPGTKTVIEDENILLKGTFFSLTS